MWNGTSESIEKIKIRNNEVSPRVWERGYGMILERARVPVTPFFSGGHTENLLTVPA
jgi:ribosomal protein L31E